MPGRRDEPVPDSDVQTAVAEIIDQGTQCDQIGKSCKSSNAHTFLEYDVTRYCCCHKEVSF